jgi:hypothetical protein
MIPSRVETMIDNAAGKQDFILAFFEDAEQRAKYLLDLHESGRASEASTLCLVYIDSFSQWLFWPRSLAGQNFVDALVEYGGALEFALVHPLAVIRAFDAMKTVWKDFAKRLRNLFSGPAYFLYPKPDFLTHIASVFTQPEAGLVEAELWRGSIAYVVYTRLRNPSVHNFRMAAEVSFDSTTYQGRPVQPITFQRLHEALLRLIAEARRRSVANNQWFGNDAIIKGA